ncbi:MAG: co-chaperone GroES [Chloroflexi bacterium]|nr:co-chaperone GroES [Chloroflexota bacterium]
MTTVARTKLIPMGDCVVVKLLNQEEVTASGIVLPDTAKEKPNQAEVIAVGPGRVTEHGQRLPMDLQPGDRVVLHSYAGNEVKLDGQEYLIIRESGILAKLD